MHAVQFLHKFIKKSCFSIHQARLNTLFVAVKGLVNKKRLTLTGIGRSIRDGSKAKHAIKRIDRLISNPHLYAERDSIYQALSSKLIGNKKHPDILIDWSPMPNLNYQLLRATLAGKGRSMVLYEVVHPARKLGNRNIQRLFLEQLKSLLPDDCQPTIITDAGFRNPWFRAVSALGWHWIGRVRGKVHYARASNTHWRACRTLYTSATRCAKQLGQILLTKRDNLPCQLILFKGKAQGRHRKNADGKPCKSKHSRVYAKRNREPWILVTSLPNTFSLAKKVVAAYRCRMQIEQNFRDNKNARFGFAFRHCLSSSIMRLSLLLLIAMLAYFVAWLVGLIAQHHQWQRDFQANTIRHRTVLSLFYLGCEVIYENYHITLQQFQQAFQNFFLHFDLEKL